MYLRWIEILQLMQLSGDCLNIHRPAINNFFKYCWKTKLNLIKDFVAPFSDVLLTFFHTFSPF